MSKFQASSRSQTLSLELEDLQNELIATRAAVEAAERSVFDANADEVKRLLELKDITLRFDEVKATVKELEGQIRKCSSEQKALTDEKVALEKKREVFKLETKKLAIQVAKHEKERNNAERSIASMLQKHVWIESEKDVFGVPGSDYDFEKADPVEMSSKLKRLNEEQSTLVSYTYS